MDTNSDTLERKDWKGGQLLAFSAIDGVTDYQNGLTARTAFEGPGIDVMLPARCRVRFSVPTDTSNTEAGFEKHGVLFEFFDDRGEIEPPELLRKGCCAPEKSPMHQVFHDYGWTAALYADMACTESRIMA